MPELFPTLLLLLVLTCSFGISTATGFGAAVMAIPVCSLFMDVKLVVPLLALASLMTCVVMGYKERALVDAGELRRILMWGGIGFPAGNAAYHLLPITALTLLLGVFVTGVAVHGLWRLYRQSPKRVWNVHIGRLLLVLGGVVQGATASGGPLIVTYAHHALPERNRFRATLFVVWIIFNSAFLISYFASAEGNPVVLLLGLYAVPSIASGIWLGQRIHRAASDLGFQILVSLLLLVSGITLLIR